MDLLWTEQGNSSRGQPVTPVWSRSASYSSPQAQITGLWRWAQPQGPYWVGGAAWGTGVTLTTHTTPFCTILLDPIWSGSCTKHRGAPCAAP